MEWASTTSIEALLNNKDLGFRMACGHQAKTSNFRTSEIKLWLKVLCPTCTAQLIGRQVSRGWIGWSGLLRSEAKAILLREMLWISLTQVKDAIVATWAEFHADPPFQIWDAIGLLEARFLEWDDANRWARMETVALHKWIADVITVHPQLLGRDLLKKHIDLLTEARFSCVYPPGQPSPFVGLDPAAWAPFIGKLLTSVDKDSNQAIF